MNDEKFIYKFYLWFTQVMLEREREKESGRERQSEREGKRIYL